MATAQRSTAAPIRTGGTEVVVERSSDHHYYADASVNGRSVHFMIDTGASETALTEADALDQGWCAANMCRSKASTSTASVSKTPRR